MLVKRASEPRVARTPAKRPNTRSPTAKIPSVPITNTQPEEMEWKTVEEEKVTKAGDLDKEENIETMCSDCQDEENKPAAQPPQHHCHC
jgi:hypothetical protein